MGYFKLAVKGVFWMSAFRVSSRAVAFFKIIILARLLTPAQIGVFGIASIMLAILEVLTETGINVFFIQEKKKLDSYVNEAWLISIARGLLISGIIIMFSSVVAAFFKTPDAQILLILISIVPFIKGFINPSIVKFQKELKFRNEFIFRFAIFAFDAVVAIVFAIVTKNPASIIFGLIAGAIFEVIFSFIFLRPVPRLLFDIRKIKEILQRGKWVTMYMIFHFLTREGDKIVVGKLLGTSFLGIYQIGYSLSTLPISEISDVANKVIFPVYSKISQDKIRLFRAFKKTTLSVSFVSILLGLFLFVMPEEMFIFILGEKWEQVVNIVKILAIYGVLRAIAGIPSTLFLSLGKQNYVAVMTFFRFATLAITIVPFTINWGIMGTVYSALISSIVEFPFITFYLIYIFNKNKFVSHGQS